MSESWKIRDRSWGPSSAEVAEDTTGPICYGRVAVLRKRPEHYFTVS